MIYPELTIAPTPYQQSQKELHSRVCGLYQMVKEANPGVAHYGITLKVASELGMTRTGVDRILTRYGLYTPKKRANKQKKQQTNNTTTK